MNRVAEIFASFTNLCPPSHKFDGRKFTTQQTHPEFCTQIITKRLRFTGSTVGSPLNLQPVLIRSCDELNWPVHIRQSVIPRKYVSSYEGIQMSNVWRYSGRGFLVRDERRGTKDILAFG